MCGILITKKGFTPNFGINHRGVNTENIEVMGFNCHHTSLPLQTGGTGLTQPLRLKRGVLLFNGEIFNFNEISKDKSDLHYLKRIFESGVPKNINSLIQKWDGFWAIVYLDLNTNLIHVWTDPLGKKQLYYSDKGICSEIKPLIEVGRGFYYSRSISNKNTTMFDYINRFMPGKYYRIKGDNLLNSMQEQIPIKTEHTDLSFYELMQISIKRRLINKIDKTTLFLSGGLDSTIILHHLLEVVDKNELEFLTLSNGEDEKFIQILEKRYQIKVRRISNDINEEEKRLAVLFYEHSVDYGSLFPQWNLVKASSNRVILTGDGADELFSGYNRALLADSQYYDVYTELPFFHHLRLDRVSMAFTKELRNPFLSREIISFALNLKWEERKGKKILRGIYKDKIPSEILGREKLPLRYKGDKSISLNEVGKLHAEIFNKFAKSK